MILFCFTRNPMSITEPHAHIPALGRNQDQVATYFFPHAWQPVSEVPVNSSVLPPPNRKTVRSVVNLTPGQDSEVAFVGELDSKTAGPSQVNLCETRSTRDGGIISSSLASLDFRVKGLTG